MFSLLLVVLLLWLEMFQPITGRYFVVFLAVQQ